MPISEEDIQAAQNVRRNYGQRWNDLATYVPTDGIGEVLAARNMSLQKIEDAVGVLNLDYYAVHITALPFLGDTYMTEFDLLQHIRTNFCGPMFIAPEFSEFEPYDSVVDYEKWLSSDPIDTVVFINIPGPDDASVICTESDDYLWRFCTITAERTGTHPVSGVREWGIEKGPDNTDGTPSYYFYIKGADRPTSIGEDIFDFIGFAAADKLWRNLQANVAKFVNDNSGVATVGETTSFRVKWYPFKEFVL
jgi:hypothetical protein